MLETSNSNIGEIRYSYDFTETVPNNRQLLVSFHATSDASTAFSASTWNFIETDFTNIFTPESGIKDFSINKELWGRARSIHFSAGFQPLTTAAGLTGTVNPVYVQYSTVEATVLLEGSAVGTYNWMSIDGGAIG